MFQNSLNNLIQMEACNVDTLYSDIESFGVIDFNKLVSFFEDISFVINHYRETNTLPAPEVYELFFNLFRQFTWRISAYANNSEIKYKNFPFVPERWNIEYSLTFCLDNIFTLEKISVNEEVEKWKYENQ